MVVVPRTGFGEAKQLVATLTPSSTWTRAVKVIPGLA